MVDEKKLKVIMLVDFMKILPGAGQIMQFLKKNYEKIVLAVVVLVTLGVVAFLPIMVSQEKQKLDDLEHQASPPSEAVGGGGFESRTTNMRSARRRRFR